MSVTAEVIEGVAREIPSEDRRLATVPRQHVQVGLGAVMTLTDDEFEANLVLLTKGIERAKRIQKAILEEGVDYGTVPGIPRPFLHKPGAEKFEKAYGLATSYTIERKVGDGDKTPELEYIVHAKVHLGDTDGPVVAEGVGSCNTHESKYRYRSAKRRCPACDTEGLIKGRDDSRLKGKWWCPPDKGGCSKTFAADDPRIVDQVVGQVENENPHDLANTILKMARKRAGVDGILTATGTSGLFTQDPDSPSVAGEPPRADAKPATSGDDAKATTAAQLPRMPKPGSISEPTSLGRITIQGAKASLGKSPYDAVLRQGAQGAALGFVIHLGDTKVPQVQAYGELATAIGAQLGDNPGYLEGRGVDLVGELWAVPWGKADEDPKPPMRRLVLELVNTGDWRVPPRRSAPAPVDAPTSQADDDDPDDAVAAVIEPNREAGTPPASADEFLEASGEVVAEAAPTELSVAEFRAALHQHGIAPALATQVMKRDFDTDALGDLEPAQRAQLLATLRS